MMRSDPPNLNQHEYALIGPFYGPRCAAVCYWLAQTMRAIQSMRSSGKTRLAWAGLKEASSTVFAVRRIRIFAITSPSVVRTHDAVAFAGRGVRRDDENVPVAVERLHGVAGDFERVGVLVVDAWGRRIWSQPSPDGEAAIVEEAAGAGLGEADQRDAARRGAACAPAVSRPMKSSKLAPVASSTLARLSVEGQRGRPSPVTRFDLLKEVASRPARLASPEAESP